MLAYFTINVWLVPFTLFISLSANENTLPTSTTPVMRMQSTLSEDSSSVGTVVWVWPRVGLAVQIQPARHFATYG